MNHTNENRAYEAAFDAVETVGAIRDMLSGHFHGRKTHHRYTIDGVYRTLRNRAAALLRHGRSLDAAVVRNVWRRHEPQC